MVEWRRKTYLIMALSCKSARYKIELPANAIIEIYAL